MLAEASELLRGLVVEQKLIHDGDPTVTSHVLAAVQRSVGAEGWRIAKPRRGADASTPPRRSRGPAG